MTTAFWVRNWEVAQELGDPTPPIKGVNELNIPIYCSEDRRRAIDYGFECVCGCTLMLRAQKRLIRQSERRVTKDELAVMGWVKVK